MTHLQVSFLDSTFGAAASKQIQSLYPLSSYATPWHALEMMDGDVSFACPARRSARWLSAGHAALPVYLYHFIHAPEITSPDKHVLCCHRQTPLNPAHPQPFFRNIAAAASWRLCSTTTRA